MIHATPDPGQVRLAQSRNGFRLAVNSDAEAAHAARHLIAGDDRLPAAAREDVLLAVTELVTNTERHAGVGAEQSSFTGPVAGSALRCSTRAQASRKLASPSPGMTAGAGDSFWLTGSPIVGASSPRQAAPEPGARSDSKLGAHAHGGRATEAAG